MPIACGNTVVLKASEMCPGTHRLIGQVLVEAGLPKGVINVVTNDPKDAAAIVEALVAHPAVRRVNFTGSTKVGRIIAELAGRHLKPALLELGGKAPLIVLDDADIDAAVNAATFGAFMHQGQICMSTERLIVDEKVADEFVAKLAARAAQLPAGDPRGHVVLGSLISSQAADKMEELVADAVAKGAKLVAGGKRTGTVVEATLLDHVTPAMRVYAGRILRAGQAGDPRQGRGRGRARRQRHRIRPVLGRLQPRHPAAPWRLPRASKPASATSTARPSATRRRCRSAASRAQATAASAARRRSPNSPICAG